MGPDLSDIDPAWRARIDEEISKDYFKNIWAFVEAEAARGRQIFPEPANIFRAFAATPLEKVRVVILGQDPYHGAGQAMGLSFSVPHGVRVPPSLRNIFKEIAADLALPTPNHGDLSVWARAGVLLLNTVLTVEEGKPHAHARRGWEEFTDAMIHYVSTRRNIAFLLWGANAREKASLIDEGQNLILTAPHPSPLSAHRGFLGCRHFSQANDYLKSRGRAGVDWRL